MIGATVAIQLRTGSAIDTASATDDARDLDGVVQRAQSGDVQAFERLYVAHAPAVHALCRRMVTDEREARDLVQDVFVRAWERLGSFRGQSALGTWIHRLAVNVVLTHLRSNRREGLRLIDDVDDAMRHAAVRDASLDAGMDIDRAVSQLPAGARIVFVLHDVHGYSHEEIAQLTGIAPGTARAQLWRARRTLTRLLDA